ncbi:MAG: double-strand break repair helicase AddA [Marivibrio sp.]|uniref:double-strand break repair helicase AddA n=1 Tax=Marivibrio sp. TaxID=2039719 RepID=UPI0032ECBE14
MSELSPTAIQQRAADPTASVWVEANAGSGKTKVLTDRVLALMVNGAKPERILCITFTKAAAAEMANRLNKRLGRWTGLDDEPLKAEIRALDGGGVNAEKLERARTLFATVLDAEGGLKIQTVHSFCQSLLGRFPLEAGVSPRFEVMEEREAADLMRTARDTVLRAAQVDGAAPADAGGGEIARALAAVTRRVNEEQFADLMRALAGERARLARALGAAGDVDGAVAAVERALGAEPGVSEEEAVRRACEDAAVELMTLQASARTVLEHGKGKGEQELARTVLAWLAAGPEGRVELFSRYRSQFLTGDYAPKKNLLTKATIEAAPDAEEVLRAEQRRLLLADERQRIQATAEATGGLIRLGAQILDAYARAKAARARLDYDDLIVKARDMLAGADVPAWVLFKLDEGLEHILIDEAQDTNPEQWEIVGALAEEFFSGEGIAGPAPRTVFAVGDGKQSIYSFQRADPEAFRAMRGHFADRAEAARQTFRGVDFDFSFRSTEAVLQAVDATFAEAPAAQGVGEEGRAVRHRPQRVGAGGRVELWPLVAPAEEEGEEDAWAPPEASAAADSPSYRLAEGIAEEVAGWIGRGETIESLGRPIRAGDVMVLVRHRTGFVDQLVRALKRRSVPVAGVDRMVLTEQIAVMDLIALGHVLLMPEDDLNLACVLKSPFVGFDDEDLFRLAHGREGESLWRRLRAAAKRDPKMEGAVDWLAGLMADADQRPPFELYHDALTREAPAPLAADGGGLPGRRALIARLGTEAEDPIEEFLSLALQHERSGPPSLQSFLAWFARGKAEIKRDLEAGERDEVRILTVHGAKGLEAPVAILPDTVSKPRGGQGPALRWFDARDEAGRLRTLPLWTPKSRYEESLALDLKLDEERAREEEYRRLLYVAMTRAQDRLILCGFHGKTAPADDCWHRLAKAGLERLADAPGFRREADAVIAPAAPVAWTGERLIFERPQAAEVAAAETAVAGPPAAPQPDWIDRPPPQDPSPPRPLSPSRPAEEDPPVRSPLLAGGGGAPGAGAVLPFRRGRLVHRLLQTLPDLPAARRRAAAQTYLARPAHGLSEDEAAALADEVMAVLEAPALAELFAPGSRAEAPIVGLGPEEADGGRPVIAGQVDRLRVTDEAVLIADYKTLRPPPADPKDAPAAYLRQMALYRRLLGEIYPGRPVRCALVWTDGPRLALLEDALLDRWG